MTAKTYTVQVVIETTACDCNATIEEIADFIRRRLDAGVDVLSVDVTKDEKE